MESSQTGPQTLTFANHPKNAPRSPPGPQIWAVVLTGGLLYYIWTKILGRPVPSVIRRNVGGHLVRKGHSAEEMAAARERQQQRLQMVVSSKQQDTTVRERVNINSGNGAKANLQEQLIALKESQAAKQKQKDLEEKKRKQRQLYLRKKAEQEKEEEERRKDEELGPGWRYRQNPDIGNAVDSMNPQAGSGGGGYKPQTCTRKGG
ncbi:hypothetical protein ACHAWO_004024 [Cyclotella atomus]|uniref:Selenoprotein S n=1 Tax=Cyclotella atomus TaxID=382360 RepID=A0ABD3P426_9STRA